MVLLLLVQFLKLNPSPKVLEPVTEVEDAANYEGDRPEETYQEPPTSPTNRCFHRETDGEAHGGHDESEPAEGIH
jgi:hypothetical protein